MRFFPVGFGKYRLETVDGAGLVSPLCTMIYYESLLDNLDHIEENKLVVPKQLFNCV